MPFMCLFNDLRWRFLRSVIMASMLQTVEYSGHKPPWLSWIFFIIMFDYNRACCPSDIAWTTILVPCHVVRAPFQYPIRRLNVRSREVSKPLDRQFKLSYRCEIWQALRQQCCRGACQISQRSDYTRYKSRGIETSRDLTIRRLFGYWNRVQVSASHFNLSPPPPPPGTKWPPCRRRYFHMHFRE